MNSTTLQISSLKPKLTNVFETDKISDCDSLERHSPLGSHFTFEGGGDRKITKDNKWSWRMINNTQRTKVHY